MEFTHLTNLPEIYEETLLYLPYEDIITLCVSHPDLSYICSDNKFWRRKVRYDFSVDHLKPEGISYRQQYRDLITFYDPNNVAEEGRLDILIVLNEKDNILPDEKGANWAARNGHLHVLEWLEKYNILPTVEGANWAAGHGELKVLEWLESLRDYDRFPDVTGADNAATNGHLPVLKLLEKHEILPNQYGTNMAAAKGHLHILQWLEKRNRLPNIYGEYLAEKNRHFDVVEWLAEIKNVPPIQ